MAREKIFIEDYERLSERIHHGSGDPEFKLVECILRTVDSEKSMSFSDLIIQRKADGKYFKGEYVECYAGEDYYEDEFTEVERKEQTTYYYI